MGLSRFELLALRLSGVYSNQLSYRPCIKYFPHYYFYTYKMEYGQVVRHQFLVLKIKGSNPFTPILIKYINNVPVAQLDRAIDYGSIG